MLIVNADDYGRAPGVSRGILEAHRQGIVTSTTVMINQPGVEPRLAEALAHPRLGVGLHLVFTAGQPVLPRRDVPGLVDGRGEFLEQHSLWARAEEIPLEQLRDELAAQVERFRALAGHLPDHLDCHHFVHLYPPFFQVYADLAHRLGLPLRVPFPLETDFRLADKKLPFLEGFPQDRVRGMIVTNTALLQARHLAHPDAFISTFFGRPSLTLEHLFAAIDGLPAGVSELMCHPGYDDPALAPSSYRDEREIELRLLTDPALRRHVEDAGVALVTYDALRAPGRGGRDEA
ncbi:MAG TPA: ChbG/HpnK family deacetylase [Anaerolineae bacterium]|nr:ChbG/HpnK family deacetylase [Anaerolineae bacterium]